MKTMNSMNVAQFHVLRAKISVPLSWYIQGKQMVIFSSSSILNIKKATYSILSNRSHIKWEALKNYTQQHETTEIGGPVLTDLHSLVWAHRNQGSTYWFETVWLMMFLIQFMVEQITLWPRNCRQRDERCRSFLQSYNTLIPCWRTLVVAQEACSI